MQITTAAHVDMAAARHVRAMAGCRQDVLHSRLIIMPCASARWCWPVLASAGTGCWRGADPVLASATGELTQAQCARVLHTALASIL